jgi:hypothetical protein
MSRSALTGANRAANRMGDPLNAPAARLVVFAILALLPAMMRANTVVSPTFDPVVRIQGPNPSSGGTGTLIGARQVASGYGMVFLAADHTLERIGPLTTIGFGNLSSPNLDIPIASALALQTYTRGPDGTEDLALIGITIALSSLTATQRSYLTGIAPIDVTTAPNPYAPFVITDFGYGKSGAIVTFGTQQSFANAIDSYLSFSGSYTTDINNQPLVYTQEMEHWTYNDPGTGDWVPGEGAGYGGFSGSPLLDGSARIQAIQSSGSDVVNGAQSIGIRFTQGYVDWIQQERAAYLTNLPEPSTSTSTLVLGVLLIVVRGRAARSRMAATRCTARATRWLRDPRSTPRSTTAAARSR